MSSTAVLLPTYQEAANIEEVLRKVRLAVPHATLLVIDDASPDGTADVAAAVGCQLDNVEVMRRHHKSGLGEAYRAGMAWAVDRGFDVIVQMDSDLSHDPAALPVLLEALDREQADLVVGSRYVPGGSIPDWAPHRRFLSKYGNLYVRLVLGLRIRDATTGYRAWRSAAVRDLALTSTGADGYTFQVETSYLAQKSGQRCVEVPIQFLDRTTGQSKMSTRIIVEALALITWWGLRDRVLVRRHSLQAADRRQG